MELQLDMTGDVPIYRQIRDAIVQGVAVGALQGGEALPTVRQLAAELSVNPMTVNKAYALLKNEGVIVIDRRHGAQIREIGQQTAVPDADFDRRLRLLLSEAYASGVPAEEVYAHFASQMRQIYQKEE